MSTSPPTTRTASSPVPARIPGRRTPTRRAVQRRDQFKAFLDHAMRLGAGRIATGTMPARGGARNATTIRIAQGLDPLKDQSHSCTLSQAQLAGRCSRSANCPRPGAPHRRTGNRPAEREEEGLDRHLLHRRAAVPRVPQSLPRQPARPDRTTAAADRRARRPVLLHARPAQGHRHRRAQGTRLRPRAAASTSPGSWRARTWRNTLVVVQGATRTLASGRCAPTMQLGGGTPPAAGGYGARRYRQADAPCAFEADTSRDFTLRFDEPQWAVDAGAIGGALRRRGVPGRQGDRAGDRLTRPPHCGRPRSMVQ